ncbi:MAG TPA: hypothetical protein VMZ00_18045 [Sporichthya sp.]|nr:hypothetical protein [Sporichthya sp.]
MRASRRIRLGLPLAAAALIAASASVQAAPDKAPKKAPTETQGQSQAVLARLVPYVGLPGVTTSVGLVTAQVANGTAQSSAAAADFGLIGMLAGGATGGKAPDAVPVPDLPSPIGADSEGTTSVERDPFADAGAPALPSTGGASDPQAFVGHESASASKDPLSATGVVQGPTLKLPNVFELAGGRSSATSTKTGSGSEVTLDKLDLGNGQVVLSGLRWVAGQANSADATSGFSLRGLTVAGQNMPVDSPAELASSLAQANEQLGPLGLVLEAPTNVADANGGTVAPLVLQIRNPEALVDPTNQASAALAPVVTQLMDAVIAANPDAAAAQIVANALVGGAGGRSGGRLEIGGVSARSALVELESGFDAVTDALTGGAAPGLTATTTTPADTPQVDAAGIGDVPASDVPVDANLVPAAQSPATQNAALGGSEDTNNGLAVLALALGLAAVIVLAVGDRLRMAASAR